MIRNPAVAGRFYPESSEQVNKELNGLFISKENVTPAIAVVCPHAGWMYSGSTAACAFSSVEIPKNVILIGPNHHNIGNDYAVYSSGSWRTPIGDVPIAEQYTSELLSRSNLFIDDPSAHALEHCLEVNLPMLFHRNPKLHIVPVLIGGSWPDSGGRDKLREIGNIIAQTVQTISQPVLLVSSTDLNHYEDQEISHKKNLFALEAILSLDEDALLDQIIGHKISMCGVGATYSTIVAAKQLGARTATTLHYQTSAEVTGDFSSVVGYAAVKIE